jgi:hypothetical protein
MAPQQVGVDLGDHLQVILEHRIALLDGQPAEPPELVLERQNAVVPLEDPWLSHAGIILRLHGPDNC